MSNQMQLLLVLTELSLNVKSPSVLVQFCKAVSQWHPTRRDKWETERLKIVCMVVSSEFLPSPNFDHM